MSIADIDAVGVPLQSPSNRGRQTVVAGVVIITGGVALQLPDVFTMIDNSRQLAPAPGMPITEMASMPSWTPSMLGGMLLVVLGLVVATAAQFRGAPRPAIGAGVTLNAIEDGQLRPIHVATAAVLTFALVVDIMKPLTIGFVLPGMRSEYGISVARGSLLPTIALLGTVVGSIVWGRLGDRYGRRTTLFLATLLFVATSVCGAMPAFEWNLVMCFIMGASVGGLLPLVFTLVAELTPRRHRGWIAVTVGGVGGLGGYLAASESAHLLAPHYTWRSLWLIGLPIGLLLLVLFPLVPESPLFLLRCSRTPEARTLLHRYGSTAEDLALVESPTDHRRLGLFALVRRYPAITAIFIVVGVAWGLVNFGFLVLLPTKLRELGMGDSVATGLLARSALYSAPALVFVVLAYARWHGRRSIAFFAGLIAMSLAGVAAWSTSGQGTAILTLSIGLLVLSLAAVNAMLLPYSAEIYPTSMRATGAGLAGAATKLGGVIGPFTMLLILKVHNDLRTVAIALMLLMIPVAALMLAVGRHSSTPDSDA
jgi:putative MFS transporter